MKNQAYRMAMLFDFYGDLLTERQREFYDLYYNEDLSLSEIEEKTHIIRRFHQSKAAIAAIDAAADALLKAVDERSYGDAMLDELARTIKENVARLNQE